MIKESGIQLPQLDLESPDMPFGFGAGAGVIFGTTGGVAEAVVRHCLPDKSRNAYYNLVEVMTCPGGCVGGAGQPHGLKQKKKERAEGLYDIDRVAPFKRAELNPEVSAVCKEYSKEKLHELLRVRYKKD